MQWKLFSKMQTAAALCLVACSELRLEEPHCCCRSTDRSALVNGRRANKFASATCISMLQMCRECHTGVPHWQHPMSALVWASLYSATPPWHFQTFKHSSNVALRPRHVWLAPVYTTREPRQFSTTLPSTWLCRCWKKLLASTINASEPAGATTSDYCTAGS
jgi:hypothetical protein